MFNKSKYNALHIAQCTHTNQTDDLKLLLLLLLLEVGISSFDSRVSFVQHWNEWKRCSTICAMWIRSFWNYSINIFVSSTKITRCNMHAGDVNACSASSILNIALKMENSIFVSTSNSFGVRCQSNPNRIKYQRVNFCSWNDAVDIVNLFTLWVN